MTTGNGEVTQQVSGIQDLQPGIQLNGKVKKIELFGAFVDLGIGTDGLLHISQLSTKHIKNVSDVVKEGDEVTVWVRNVDVGQGRIDLTMIQPVERQMKEIQVGQSLKGKVVRLEKFGAFIDIGAERPGMVHVSEMGNGYINSPGDVVHVGQEVDVRVIKVNSKKKQIDLSMKQPEEQVVMPQDEQDENVPTAMELALRRAMQGTEMAADFEAARKQKPQRKDKSSDKRRQQQDELLQRTLQNRVK